MDLAARQCVRLVVATLDWLALGCPRRPPLLPRDGAPPSAMQADMVQRLEHMARFWLSRARGAAKHLSRAFFKFSSMHEAVAKLQTAVQHDLLPYGRSSCRGRAGSAAPPPGGPDGSSARPPSSGGRGCAALPLGTAKVVGSAPTSTVALDIVADKIRFDCAPTFDPLPFLADPLLRASFLDPAAMHLPERLWPSGLKRPRVRASREEQLRLYMKWDAFRFLVLVPASRSQGNSEVGCFRWRRMRSSIGRS